jgi:carbohydrate-selective porin OprB
MDDSIKDSYIVSGLFALFGIILLVNNGWGNYNGTFALGAALTLLGAIGIKSPTVGQIILRAVQNAGKNMQESNSGSKKQLLKQSERLRRIKLVKLRKIQTVAHKLRQFKET